MIAAPADGIIARQREVKPIVELRVPFELDRQMIDDVERGANDSDWQPVKDAARKPSPLPRIGRFSRAMPPAGIQGIREGSQQPGDDAPRRCRATTPTRSPMR